MNSLNKTLRVGILFSALLISCASFSQNVENPPSQSFYVLAEELHGKYQIQMLGVRTKPMIPQELLIEIKERQQQSERVFFQYKETIRIMILSKDEILNGQVISDDDHIIYFN